MTLSLSAACLVFSTMLPLNLSVGWISPEGSAFALPLVNFHSMPVSGSVINIV